MKSLTITAVMALATAGAVHADEFTDVMGSALESYKAGDVSATREDLDYATKLLAGMESASLSAFLPAPLSGWERSDTDAQGIGMGMAMFGGGTAAAATYSGGGEDLTITIITDSPMVASLSAVITGLAVAPGTTPIRIQRVQFMENDGELQGIIDNRILVTVSGSASLETKKAYLETMDIDGLKAL